MTSAVCSAEFLEATSGFEPLNRGFADLRPGRIGCSSRSETTLDDTRLHESAANAAVSGAACRFLTRPSERIVPCNRTAAEHPVVGVNRFTNHRNFLSWCPLDQPCHADVLLELANA